jgi:putative nucleotidyltransferase with HDIG domain
MSMTTAPLCSFPHELTCSIWASPQNGGRLITATELRFSEIISALSVALDITTGQPKGHGMRTALIGMRLAEELQLTTADRSALFYALLLKDLGCSSNAAKIAHLFGADDHLVKRSMRMVDWTKPSESFSHCWQHAASGGTIWSKMKKIVAMFMQGEKGARQISEARCHQGATISSMLQLPEATSRAIYELDEHWNGRGFPNGLKGEEISLLGRICCLAQTVEVFVMAFGLEKAIEVAGQRSGQWFDPQLMRALLSFKDDQQFWERLNAKNLVGELARWEPAESPLLVDQDGLDLIAEAFAKVVDAKSPWTYKHSTRVAEISVGVACNMGCSDELARDIRRAALLHDLGKLGVPNTILDKPGKPTEEEMAIIYKHPEYTEQILGQVNAFAVLSDVAGAHHERLDGKGYHRSRKGEEISWVGRVLTVSDICEALSAQRPYRDAMPWEKIKAILLADAGRGVDPDCLQALIQWYESNEPISRIEDQLCEVDRLLSQCQR